MRSPPKRGREEGGRVRLRPAVDCGLEAAAASAQPLDQSSLRWYAFLRKYLRRLAGRARGEGLLAARDWGGAEQPQERPPILAYWGSSGLTQVRTNQARFVANLFDCVDLRFRNISATNTVKTTVIAQFLQKRRHLQESVYDTEKVLKSRITAALVRLNQRVKESAEQLAMLG